MKASGTMTGQTANQTAGQQANLSTERTITRSLVHRAALAEVFLTDFQSVDDRTFLAAAQLPPGHFYYGDHTYRPAIHDPLVVFESVRQMLLCAMHLQHGADHNTKAITADASMEITDPRPLLVDGRALDLAMDGEVPMEKTHEGAVSRVVHEVRVRSGDRTIGNVRVDTALRPPDAFQKLRMSHRSTPPPYSDAVPVTHQAEPVAAHLVGREQARNVVLGDVRATDDADDAVTARLCVPVAHPSMFDHAQDHVPGPVLMEAGRQAAIFLAGDRFGLAPAKLYLRDVYAAYSRFMELDSDILVRARVTGGADHSAGGALDGRTIEVTFEQSGAVASRLEIKLGSTLELDREGEGRGNGG